MVITGKPRVDSVEDFLQQNALSAENNLINLVDPGDTTDTASIASTLQTQSSVQGLVINLRHVRRPARQHRYPRPTDFQPSRKMMGGRKLRRYQNNLGLLSGIEEEMESPEESFAEAIAEENVTVFSELFENPSKMQIWEKFMKMSESEQRRLLMAVADDFERNSRAADYDDADAEDHPHTAEECFRRIDRQLRHLIARRSPPVDIIEPMEKELVDFFGERPQEVLDVSKPDTYHRMIFHAICQYFGLRSKSVKTRQSCRTQVKNRSQKGIFLQPPQRLSVYLSQHYE